MTAKIQSPLFTMAEAAAYLRLPSAEALRQYRHRHHKPRGVRIGRCVLFEQRDLDDFIATFREGPRDVCRRTA